MTDSSSILTSLLDVNEKIYAFDYHCMISDVESFLDFSENNIEELYKKELLLINNSDYSYEYRKLLEQNIEYRFKTGLPISVRYSAVIALVTSVELAAISLNEMLKQHLKIKIPPKTNKSLFLLKELTKKTGLELEYSKIIKDYEDIIAVRNCIVHSMGKYKKAIEQLKEKGFCFKNGMNIYIEKNALNIYIEAMNELVVNLYKSCDEKGFLK